MEQVRIGVIGCGIGAIHLEGYEQEPRAKIMAIAGLDEDRCAQLVQRFNIPQRYRDYRDMLENPEIDAVSVAVPNHLHAEVALAALEAGKHVLVEKPLARTIAEAEQIVRAGAVSGKVLGTIFDKRGRCDMEYVGKLAHAGYFGELYYVKAFWVRRSGIPGLGSWFTKKELSGGGPLIDLGVHMLDLSLWMLGNPDVTTISASTFAKLGPQGKGNWPRGRFQTVAGEEYGVEDLATAFLRTSNGATVQLEVSWASFMHETDAYGVEIMGDKGGARVYVKDYAKVGEVQLFSDLNGAMIDTTPRLYEQHSHGRMISNFMDAIVDGVPMSPNGDEGLNRVRLLEAIYESAERGRELEFGV
ncbi:MAG: Gfo/Idh/MocA family oxidoreductase [Thermomicrobiales bacterium]|nr:Gfo/Idh/MocA family oxidoreductase [Thermomicrobiales bacterium]